MLSKHIRRYIYRSNRWLVLAIGVLVLIMGVLFFSIMLMSNSYNQQLKVLDLDGRQEHFQFLPLLDGIKSLDEAVKELESTYNFTSEQQKVKYTTSNGVYYKILNAVEHINTPILHEGQLADSAGELVIDVNSAERLGLVSGEYIYVEGERFRISGIATFPSQLTPNMSYDAYIPYHVNHSIVLAVNDNGYDRLAYQEQIVYSARWTDKPKQLDEDQFSFVLHAEKNSQVNGLILKQQMNTMIAGLSTGILATIVMIMLQLLIYKMIKDNEQAFALLKSIGYKNSQIVTSCVPLILLLILPVLISYTISSIFQSQLFSFMNQDIIVAYLHAERASLLFIISSAIFILPVLTMSVVTLLLLLRKSLIAMLNQGVQSHQISSVKRLILGGFSWARGVFKLQLKFILSYNFVLFLTIFTGFALGVQLILSFSLYEFPKKLVAGIEQQYYYKLNIIFQNSVPLTEFTVTEGTIYTNIKAKVEHEGGSESAVLHILHNYATTGMIELKAMKNQSPINHQLEQGVIVSKWYANKHNLTIGDLITITEDDINRYEIPISGIHMGLQGDKLISSKSYYTKVTNNTITEGSGFYGNRIDQLSTSETIPYSILNQAEIVNAAGQTVQQYRIISIFLFIIGILLAVILFLMALYIVMQNGEKHILLLKTIGYTNRQVSRISIDSYLICLLLGIVVSVPYIYMLSIILFNPLSRLSSFYLPIEINLVYLSLILFITIGFFYMVAFLYMRKIARLKNFTPLLQE